MGVKFRYFSVQEANEVLPEVRAIFGRIMERRDRLAVKVAERGEKEGGLSPVDEAIVEAQLQFLSNEMEQDLNRLAEIGCVPKDLNVGLVDFPSRRAGREVFLCWRWGEEEVNHWHGLTEGAKARKPL